MFKADNLCYIWLGRLYFCHYFSRHTGEHISWSSELYTIFLQVLVKEEQGRNVKQKMGGFLEKEYLNSSC